MSHRQLFRVLVGCDASLLVGGVLWSLARPASDASVENEWSTITLVLALIVAVGTVISLIGLWRFWGPARLLYLTVLVVALGLTATGPVESVSGVESALTSLEMVVAGVIVARMYSWPVRLEFECRAPVV